MTETKKVRIWATRCDNGIDFWKAKPTEYADAEGKYVEYEGYLNHNCMDMILPIFQQLGLQIPPRNSKKILEFWLVPPKERRQ